MIRLVLDTNILASANINEEGLGALVVSLGLNEKVQLCVSEPILKEYEQVLLYPRLKFSPAEVARFLARLRSVSILAAPTRTVAASTDEPDNRFLGVRGSRPRAFSGYRQQTAFPQKLEDDPGSQCQGTPWHDRPQLPRIDEAPSLTRRAPARHLEIRAEQGVRPGGLGYCLRRIWWLS